MNNQIKRTWCKYGNCWLEKLENELKILNKLWINLENNWENPEDFEDLYRIYPLLDTTAALARKIITHLGKKNDNDYKVDVIYPGNKTIENTSDYIYCDEHKFFNGHRKRESLKKITSTFLHCSEYVYMDTRKINKNSNFQIYVFAKTDRLCQSCADINIKNPKKDGVNYRKHASHIQFGDCICGCYINVRDYINSISKLLNKRIDELKK